MAFFKLGSRFETGCEREHNILPTWACKGVKYVSNIWKTMTNFTCAEVGVAHIMADVEEGMITGQ